MDYKFCPNCGKEVQPNSNACTECGTILNEKAVREINAPKIPNGININIDKNKIKDNVNSLYNNVKNIDTDKIKQNVDNVYNNAVDVAKSKKKVTLIAGVVAVITVIAIVLIAILGGNGGSKAEQAAIDTVESNFYSGIFYEQLVLTIKATDKNVADIKAKSTIAAKDKLGVVYIVDMQTVNISSTGEEIPSDEEHGYLAVVVRNDDGSCVLQPDFSWSDNSYYDAESKQELLNQLQFEWITAI
ncbi:MAG: zinc ribbon domain-containing protein [Eubacterium sp.]|nr:zinc ribbon domain-containing protein [Eubacterium sp.]